MFRPSILVSILYSSSTSTYGTFMCFGTMHVFTWLFSVVGVLGVRGVLGVLLSSPDSNNSRPRGKSTFSTPVPRTCCGGAQHLPRISAVVFRAESTAPAIYCARAAPCQ